jgi:hypothetical protein
LLPDKSVTLNNDTRIATRIISSWTTSCSECGFGKGSWADSPALDRHGNKVPLTPSSPVCHGCGVVFTHEYNVYGREGRVEIGV